MNEDAAQDDAETAAVTETLLGRIRECVQEADASKPEIKPLPTDDVDPDAASLSWLAAQAIYLAWVMSIDALVEENDDTVVTSAMLDEAMLPHGTDDDEIVNLSGGLADGPFTREVLKRLKAKLPVGKFLPDEMIALLKQDDVTVA